MLLIKFIKVQNLTYSEFKHYKTILMLCKKIEIDQSKRFTQIIETKIYELQRFPQIRMGINISVFLSESYIQKKNLHSIVLHRFTQNLEISYHSCRQTLKKIGRINMNIVINYMNKIKIRSFLKTFAKIWGKGRLHKQN